jgi:hypothetical protein
MSSLAALQRRFASHLLGGDAVPPIAPAVVASTVADSTERLGVYRHAYRARLVEVLGNDFPSLRTLAGEQAFAELAQEYVAATPSRHFNVRWYGTGLAEFLRASGRWRGRPELGDMAALEWAIGLSFDAADDRAVGVHEIAAIAPEQWPGLRLQLHVAVQRIELRWNVGEIRRAIDNRGQLPSVRCLDEPEAWIVSRQDEVVRFRRLDPDEAVALDAAHSGACFAELCELLSLWHEPEAVALRAATLFKAWVLNRWISGLRVDA